MKTDGILYVLVAFFGAILSALGSDDAAKYIAPATLWYVKNACAALAAGVLALKMFRSTTFADHKATEDKKTTAATIQSMPPSQAP